MFSIAMQDMAKTPADIKEDLAEMSQATAADIPKYPYGLCISLDEEDLAKLGIQTDTGAVDVPDIGDMIHLFAFAKVTSVSQRENADGSPCCRIELQITHLGLEDEDDETMDDESMEA